MIRRPTTPLVRCCAAILSTALVSGCALFNDHRETIIRVESSRNRVKAQRLTLAGVQAMNMGQLSHAHTKFHEALAADETYGPAHNNLGLLHFDRGELYDAVLSFERASELIPNDPTVYYNLALALESAGQVHEALDLYWQAVEMDPTNPNYLGNLVRLRVRLGENSPEVVSQLQDLILVETRPEWRQWADRQLAIDMNETLDRGPDAPEFDALSDKESSEATTPPKTVIDLTPSIEGASSEIPQPPSPGIPATEEALPAPKPD
jgi:tetratricopeptide (TPR) repeat protein